jgi:transcriptional regulator with XRE-family HTH domain
LFAQKLKKLREKKGLSQQGLAEKAGTNKMRISKYETGKSTPGIDILGKIAKALDVTTDYLIFDNVPHKDRIEVKDLELMEKFHDVEQLSEEDRKTIKTLLDAMLIRREVEGAVKYHNKRQKSA